MHAVCNAGLHHASVAALLRRVVRFVPQNKWQDTFTDVVLDFQVGNAV
jgi:Tfp pilus assembly ATPase PilU